MDDYDATAWRDEAEAQRDRELFAGLAGAVPRSPRWRPLREAFLVGKVCLVCGGRKKLVAHHRLPFHLFPQFELFVPNLRPICEAGPMGLNCHGLAGHGGNWSDYIADVDDAARTLGALVAALIADRTRG